MGNIHKIDSVICTLSTNEKTGWKKQLCLVSWNDNLPKYDIRAWSPDYKRMGKGVTLDEAEFNVLSMYMRGELDEFK